MLPASARAEPEGGRASHPEKSARVLVERFVGEYAKAARAAVLAGIERENSLDLVAIRAVEARGSDLDGSAPTYATLARELGVDAFIAGKINRTEEGFVLRVTVISGRTGQVLGHARFEARDLPRLHAITSTELGPRILPLLAWEGEPAEEASAASVDVTQGEEPLPPAAATAPTASALERPRKASPRADPTRARSAAICELAQVNVGGGVFSRTLAFEGEVPGPLRGQRIDPVPTAALRVNYFPLHHSTCGAWSGLLLRARHEQALHAESRVARQTLRTVISDTELGLGYRVGHPKLFAEPAFSYAFRRLEVGGDYLPASAYGTFRVGLMLGAELTPAILEMDGAYHFVNYTTPLNDSAWFPLAQGRGYEAGIAAGLRLGRAWAVLASARRQAMRFTLNTQPPFGYPHGVAAEMHDEFSTALLWLRWTPLSTSR